MLAQLRTRASTDRPALIVIDPLQRFLRLRDISDYAEQSNKFDPVIVLAREVSAAIVFSHHAPKGDREDVGRAGGPVWRESRRPRTRRVRRVKGSRCGWNGSATG